MATLSVKPSPRFQLPDWHTNSYLLSTNAERQRDASHQIRQEAQVLCNETNNQVGGRSPVGWERDSPQLPTTSLSGSVSSRPFGTNMTIGLDWQRGLILSTGGRRCWTSV